MNTTLDPERAGRRDDGQAVRRAPSARSRATRSSSRPSRTRGDSRKDVAFSSHFPGQDPAGGPHATGAGRSSRRRTPSSARRAATQRHDRVHASASAPASSAARASSSSASSGDGMAFLHASGALQEMHLPAGRDAARRHRLHRRDGVAGRLRHPDGAGHQDGAVRRRRIVLRALTRSGTRAAADAAVLAPRRSHSRRGAERTAAASQEGSGTARIGAAGIIGGVLGSMMDGRSLERSVSPSVARAIASSHARHRNTTDSAKSIPLRRAASARGAAPPACRPAPPAAAGAPPGPAPRGEIVALQGSISRCARASSSACSAPTAPARRRRSAFSPRACRPRRARARVGGADVISDPVARAPAHRRRAAAAESRSRPERPREPGLSRRVLRHCRVESRRARASALLEQLGIARQGAGEGRRRCPADSSSG